MAVGLFLFFFVVIPILVYLFGTPSGNVALIPIEGTITSDGNSLLGQSSVSSTDIVGFLKEAEENPSIKAIVLEINSPGGSAVASDEIAAAVKKCKKPVIAVIREMGASGGYWVASSTNHIIANRMSITGSIGVISSYLEFSGLMEKYGVRYEQLTAGEYKDMGTPFKSLTAAEKMILQEKLDKIHDIFIQEIAANRNLPEAEVRKLATGEFFLGVEAVQNGLVDELGNKDSASEYLKETYKLEDVEYVTYKKSSGLLEILEGVTADFSYHLGQGMSSIFVRNEIALT